MWKTYNKNKKWTYIVSTIEILGFMSHNKTELILIDISSKTLCENLPGVYTQEQNWHAYVFFSLTFWLHLTACGILILQPGIKPHFPPPPTALEGRVLNTRLAGKLVCIHLAWLSTDIALQDGSPSSYSLYAQSLPTFGIFQLLILVRPHLQNIF